MIPKMLPEKLYIHFYIYIYILEDIHAGSLHENKSKRRGKDCRLIGDEMGICKGY